MGKKNDPNNTEAIYIQLFIYLIIYLIYLCMYKKQNRYVKALVKEGQFYDNGTVVARECERVVRAWKQAAESALYPDMTAGTNDTI